MAMVVRSIDNLATLDRTKRTIPSGGCRRPIIRLSVIMKPKCTGSMPTFTMTGIKTGTRMLIDAIGSRKQPMTRSRTVVRGKIRERLSDSGKGADEVEEVRRVVGGSR